ncbi:response regulator [Streptomyces sp. NPDC055056]
MIRVLLVDDDPIVRAGLRVIFSVEPDIEVVGEAPDGSTALSVAQEHHADIALVDVRMPGLDGISTTQALLALTDGPTHVLVLTTFDTDEYVHAALRAGADGFLLKRARPEEIVQALRTVTVGGSVVLPERIRTLMAATARHDRRAVRLLDSLTSREREVLMLAARGLTNDEIAQKLVVGRETIKTHMSAIFAKLAARDRTQAVITAYEGGLILPGTPDNPHAK